MSDRLVRERERERSGERVRPENEIGEKRR